MKMAFLIILFFGLNNSSFKSEVHKFRDKELIKQMDYIIDLERKCIIGNSKKYHRRFKIWPHIEGNDTVISVWRTFLPSDSNTFNVFKHVPDIFIAHKGFIFYLDTTTAEEKWFVNKYLEHKCRMKLKHYAPGGLKSFFGPNVKLTLHGNSLVREVVSNCEE
jgi:hypothetical protein